MDILYNKEGAPLMMNSTLFIADTITDKKTLDDRRRVLFPYDDTQRGYIYVGDERVVAWGCNNRFP